MEHQYKKIIAKTQEGEATDQGQQAHWGEDLNARHPHVRTLPNLPHKVIFCNLSKLCIKEENQEIGSSSLSLENSDTKPDRLSQKLT